VKRCCDEQTRKSWRKNVLALSKYHRFRVGTFYFESSCGLPKIETFVISKDF